LLFFAKSGAKVVKKEHLTKDFCVLCALRAQKSLSLHAETKKKAMALNSNKELKQYYSITEVSEMFSLPASLLRFWEKEFPTIRPKKNNNGIRIYTKADIEEIRLVYDLVKGRNMKLAAARELIQRNREGAKNSSDLLQRLQSVRDQLLEIKKELEGIV
jgi:DNA-binding transcriptional MerR regulator